MRRTDLFLLMAAVAIVGANSLSLSPIALSIGETFGAGPGAVMSAATLFGLVTAASALVLAPALDRIGLSRALCLALFGLALALAATAAAPTLAGFRWAQALAGLATGVALPATYGLAAERAPEGQSSVVLGRVLTGWTLSMVFGASGAAVLADAAGWRAVYGVLSGGAAIAVFAAAAGGFLRAPLRPHSLPSPWAALSVRGIWRALGVCAVYMMAFYGLYGYLGTHLRRDLGVDPALAGLAPLAYGLGFGAAVWADPLIDRLGPRRVAAPVFGLLVGVYVAIGASAASAMALIALSALWGAVNHAGLNLIVGRLAALDPVRRGAILGLNSGVTYLALFAGTEVLGWIYARAGFAAAAGLAAVFILPALTDALWPARGVQGVAEEPVIRPQA
jgi:predicted MFS family arabinose efflux permease